MFMISIITIKSLITPIAWWPNAFECVKQLISVLFMFSIFYYPCNTPYLLEVSLPRLLEHPPRRALLLLPASRHPQRPLLQRPQQPSLQLPPSLLQPFYLLLPTIVRILLGSSMIVGMIFNGYILYDFYFQRMVININFIMFYFKIIKFWLGRRK